VDHLTRSVHAGVGTTGTGGLDGVIGDPAQGGFDGLLHGALGWLPLPAGKRAAVVLDFQGDAHGLLETGAGSARVRPPTGLARGVVG
jgi:hypothetical protein